MTDDELSLSPQSRQRREAILRLAQAAARRRRRGRKWARATASTAVLVIASLLAWTHRPGETVPQPLVIRPTPAVIATTQPAVTGTAPTRAPDPKKREVVIRIIVTDPGIARRLAIPPQPPTWRRLSDEDLLRELTDAGRPAGLAWVDGREVLLSREDLPAGDRRLPGRAKTRPATP